MFVIARLNLAISDQEMTNDVKKTRTKSSIILAQFEFSTFVLLKNWLVTMEKYGFNFT